MAYEQFIIEVNGEEIRDLYANLISLEIELDEVLASLFRLHIAMTLQSGGHWTFLDDERLRIWQPVTLSAGFAEGVETIMSGYITHIKPYFDSDPTQCTLEILGMDGSVLMDRQEKLKAWPNKKDSDIAAELFNLYGFTPEVEDTPVIHDEAVSTIIQRETDIQFLRRLALRNGFECFVEGKKGYFRKPRLEAEPQPVLAAHFGNETVLNRIAIEVNALIPANVAMSQIDRVNKTISTARIENSQQTVLGYQVARDLLTVGVHPGQVYMRMTAATGHLEMQALCQGLFHQGEWFVTAVGEVAGNRYAHVLKPKKTVVIKGIGETYSGTYYITHITHIFSNEGYIQSFQAKRNAIGMLGLEAFTEEV